MFPFNGLAIYKGKRRLKTQLGLAIYSSRAISSIYMLNLEYNMKQGYAFGSC
jgi:hypothetical protein